MFQNFGEDCVKSKDSTNWRKPIPKVHKCELSSINILPKNDVEHYDTFLVSFLEGLSNRNISSLDSQLQYQLIMTIEAIYSFCNVKWIFPYHFVSNVVQSFISGSKVVSVLNGKLTPGGGYTTFLNWLNEIGSAPLECHLGDIITFIDNIGKYIIKNYRVSKDKVGAADVITTTLRIILRTIHSLQTDASLKPIVWGVGLTVEQKQEKMETFIQNSRI
eukprot:TCONS_00029400-protein